MMVDGTATKMEWPDYDAWINNNTNHNSNQPITVALPDPYSVRFNHSDADLPTGPLWIKCAQTSLKSYLNFSFSPYPIQRRQTLNVSLQGWLEDDIPEGTLLEMYSWRQGVRLWPGPHFSLDVCKFFEEEFKDAAVPVRCPLNSYGTLLLMNALKQKYANTTNSMGTDTSMATNSTGGAGMFSVKVPWWIVGGRYRATVQLRSGKRIMTCATTLLRIR